MANPACEEIVQEIRRFAATAKDLAALQEFCAGVLAERLPYYNWVGFYMLDAGDESVLVLGPYRGAPTEHIRIPVTEGICGAAVAQGETVIVDDVAADRGIWPALSRRGRRSWCRFEPGEGSLARSISTGTR